MCMVILFYLPKSKNTSEKGLIDSHNEKLICNDYLSFKVPVIQTTKY